MRPSRALLAAILAGPLASLSCVPDRSVVRIQDGQETQGRFISPEAYRAFAAGALAEARGDLRAAQAAYERTLREDPRAAEAWSGLGRVLCTTSRDAADRALARARELGAELLTPFLAAAECELARDRPDRAATFAEEAARRSPSSREATLLVAQALRRSGHDERAELWLEGLRLLEPGSNDTAEAGSLPHEPPADAEAHPALHAALRRLRADPRDADARIAALVAADLAGDEAIFTDAAAPPGAPMDAPSAEGAELLEALLARRVGRGAARAFREAYGAGGAAAPAPVP